MGVGGTGNRGKQTQNIYNELRRSGKQLGIVIGDRRKIEKCEDI